MRVVASPADESLAPVSDVSHQSSTYHNLKKHAMPPRAKLMQVDVFVARLQVFLELPLLTQPRQLFGTAASLEQSLITTVSHNRLKVTLQRL